MKNLFNSVKMTRPKSNLFDLTHDVKLSLNMGELIPILAMDCVPGDRIKLSCESLLRFAPLVSPVMHRMDVTMHYYFVPHRITWPNFEKYITNTKLEGGSLPAFPTLPLNSENYASWRLYDYLGLPQPPNDPSFQTPISALPFAAYQKIYNDYYVDQNNQGITEFTLLDGDNSSQQSFLSTLKNRAYEHDYFTSALPFAQKGDAVTIPIGSQEVVLKPDWETTDPTPNFQKNNGTLGDGNIIQETFGSDAIIQIEGDPENRRMAYNPDGTLVTTDTGEATTINDLRRAFRLQEWLEKQARGGTRYIESILAHFGVRSSDKRLQRAEYITGTKSPVNISEVLNTTGTEDLPQGNMSGHAVSVTSGKYESYYCEEHGYIIGIMSVMPKTAYQQGIPKHFLKTTDPTEFFWPSFAHLGEQEIQNQELYLTNDPEYNTGTFGYIPRYAEYKYMSSRVAGDFKTSLAFWHLGRIFENEPQLNGDFIAMNPDNASRIFAVEDPSVQKLYCHVLNKITASRPMPKYGTPTF